MNNNSLADLRRLNFEELIHIDTNDASNYTYETYASNGKIHKIKTDDLSGGCSKCESNGCVKDASHKLRFISHGAHTVDFLSTKQTDFSGWSNASVLFLLESPGGDGGFYADEKEFRKRPTKQWYWVHGGYEELSLELNTKRRKFGEFFASIMNHFKLSNVYVTNLVKCGLEKNGIPEYNIQNYDKAIVTNCFKEYLDKELDIIKPQAVFTFGGRVYNEFKKEYSNTYPENIKLFCMPHPSGRISQAKYRLTAITYLLIGLHKSRVFTEDEAKEHLRLLNWL